jgi:hypothetical protein
MNKGLPANVPQLHLAVLVRDQEFIEVGCRMAKTRYFTWLDELYTIDKLSLLSVNNLFVVDEYQGNGKTKVCYLEDIIFIVRNQNMANNRKTKNIGVVLFIQSDYLCSVEDMDYLTNCSKSCLTNSLLVNYQR